MNHFTGAKRTLKDFVALLRDRKTQHIFFPPSQVLFQWRANTLRRDRPSGRSDEVVRLQRASTPQILLLGVFSS